MEIIPAPCALGAEIGSTVAFESIAGGARGYYHLHTRHIGIEAKMAVNQQAATPGHELAHALVRVDRKDDDPALDYAAEELVVESVAFTVIRSLGIDTDAKSIPYLASWAEKADLSVIESTTALIDRLAQRIEHAIDGDLDTDKAHDEHQLATAVAS